MYDKYCTDHYGNGHCDQGCNSQGCGWDGLDCFEKEEDKFANDLLVGSFVELKFKIVLKLQ